MEACERQNELSQVSLDRGQGSPLSAASLLLQPFPLFPYRRDPSLGGSLAQESAVSLPLATRGQIVLMDFPDEFGVGVCPLASPLPLFPSHLLLCSFISFYLKGWVPEWS